jgi:ribonuclease HII
VSKPALGDEDRKLLDTAAILIGLDEVGRGSLAGPVVVCGVSFNRVPEFAGVQDSKALTPRQRARAAAWVKDACSGVVVIEVWPEIIDRINILNATRLAMRAALAAVAQPGAVAVVDAVDLGGDNPCPVHALPRADATYFCVAAASIVAKVHRDQLMVALAADHPGWRWERNKGYPTREHREALGKHGRSFLHRRSFGRMPVLP